MNTLLLRKLTSCAALAVALQTAHAQTDTMYIGPNNGLYSNSANWSNGIPINNTFHAINNTNFIILLDIDPTINSLTLGHIGQLFGTDHNFTVTGSTSMGAGNRIDVVAQSLPNVKFDLGNLTNFSGTTLNSGGYFVTAAPGTTSKLQFNGANIVTNNALIGIIGAGAAIVDQNGVNALANLTTNGVNGFIRIGNGASFTTANNFTNGGYMVARPGCTYTFNGSFACVTNPANPDAGLFEVFGTDLGPTESQGNGLLAANGSFGDVNPAGDTLVDGQLTTVSNGSATAMIRFNNANIININNAASIGLIGPNSRIVDQSGNDGLRNLATNDGYVTLARQSRSTVGALTNNGVLADLGGGNLTVGGSMTNNGVFGVLPFDIFLLVHGVPGFDPAPGSAITTLVTINGNLTLGSTSDYVAEVYDPTITASVRVNGIAGLGGVLELLLIDPSLVTSTDTFTLILTDGQITGAFANVLSGGRLDATQDTDTGGTGDVVGSFRVNYNGNSLTITDFQVPQTATPTPTPTPGGTPTPTPTPAATPTPTPTPPPTPTPTPTPRPATLGNISTRLQVGTSDRVMIAGFIVQGSSPKRVLIRAAGPSLTQFGVPNALANPQLELHDSKSTIGMNNDWQTTQVGGVITSDQAAEIQSSGLAPSDPLESAIIATLAPGSYTAIVQGVNNGTGVGIVEVYDLTATSGSLLANISTRGFVQTGDDVMIGGFIVVTQPTRVIIRAIGPSLTQSGVPDALANPQLELHDATSLIGQNDDWQTTQIGGIIASDQVAEIQSSQLAPTNSAESAIIATLQPGSYTATVRGVNNTTGNALVEVYALQ